MPKIKVIEVIRQGEIGGGETYVLNLVKRLDATRFEPVVLSFSNGAMIEQLKKMGTKTFVIESKSPFNFSLWDKIKVLLESEKIEIVHAHGTKALSNILYPAKRLKLPLLYSVHGWSFHAEQSALNHFLRKQCEIHMGQRTDKVFLPCPSEYEYAQQQLKLSNATLLTHQIDMSRFDVNHEETDFRRKYRIPADKILVGYLARLTLQKDPLTMVRAVAEVVRKNRQAFFFLGGEGELKTPMVTLLKKMNVTSNVVVGSFLQDVPSFLKAIDVYCLPSLWEGFSLSILEAMAMKKPVIATPVNGAKDVIEDQKTGFFMPPKNYKVLAEAILKLVDNAELRKEMGENAYSLVKRSFGNPNIMMMQLQNHYISLCRSYNK